MGTEPTGWSNAEQELGLSLESVLPPYDLLIEITPATTEHLKKYLATDREITSQFFTDCTADTLPIRFARRVVGQVLGALALPDTDRLLLRIHLNESVASLLTPQLSFDTDLPEGSVLVTDFVSTKTGSRYAALIDFKGNYYPSNGIRNAVFTGISLA